MQPDMILGILIAALITVGALYFFVVYRTL